MTINRHHKITTDFIYYDISSFGALYIVICSIVYKCFISFLKVCRVTRIAGVLTENMALCFTYCVLMLEKPYLRNELILEPVLVVDTPNTLSVTLAAFAM